MISTVVPPELPKGHSNSVTWKTEQTTTDKRVHLFSSGIQFTLYGYLFSPPTDSLKTNIKLLFPSKPLYLLFQEISILINKLYYNSNSLYMQVRIFREVF